jgi:glycosyltransferase involved in cell wall biosynthesis
MIDKIPLTGLIICKNEAETIGTCLRSLSFLDQVLVLDNGSTDHTKEIAIGFENVDYYQVEWKGFSQTKQDGLALSRNDWVFWIDSDESVSEELKQALEAWRPDLPEDVYSVLRLNFFFDKPIHFSGWQNEWIVRIFNRNASSFDGSEVHEKLLFKGQNRKLSGHLNHRTYKNIDHYFEKFQNYTSLNAQKKIKLGKKVSFLDFIFRPYFRFFRHYILKLGFMDGKEGFIISMLSSASVFIRDLKVFYHQKRKE